MAVVVESTTTANWATGSTTFTQNKPSGTTDGDFLLAVVFTGNDNGTTTLTVTGVPSGWTLVDEVGQDSAGFNPVRVYTYYKIASSEGASWDWTLSTSGSTFFYAGCVFRISGTSQVSSSDDGVVANDDTPTFTGGVTPVGANSLLVMATAVTNGATAGLSSGSYAITTDNPTWTELLDDSGGEGSGSSVHASVAYAIRSASTATGDWTLTLSGGTGVADSASLLLTIPAILNANGNHTILTSTSSIFNHTISVGTTASHTILTQPHEIFSQNGKIEENRWTDTEKGTKSWTNQKK